MNKNCINCKYYGSIMMCCFNDKNEGIRIFNPENNTCVYFTPKDKN